MKVLTKVKNVYWWIRHRTFDKYHIVHTGLEPGYYDKDTQMFHAMFQLLVDYVEDECAQGDDIGNEMQNKPIIKSRRDAGLSYLQYQSDWMKEELVEYTREKDHFREIITIYRWWTEDRPRRCDPWELFVPRPFEDMFTKDNNLGVYRYSPPDIKKNFKHIDPIEVEDEYEEEDTEMACRLVKIRAALWT